MSPRAAGQLESFGFEHVYDYVAGKNDWLSNGLPVEGEDVDMNKTLFAGDVAQRDVPTCRLGERLGPVRDRVMDAGRDTCIVLNAEDVVLGRLRSRDLDAVPETQVEDVMEIGPTTFRPGIPLEELTERMEKAHVNSVLITTAEGQFTGVLYIEDAHSALREKSAQSARR
jgi:Mg/Co/Ni transporter MgtE